MASLPTAACGHVVGPDDESGIQTDRIARCQGESHAMGDVREKDVMNTVAERGQQVHRLNRGRAQGDFRMTTRAKFLPFHLTIPTPTKVKCVWKRAGKTTMRTCVAMCLAMSVRLTQFLFMRFRNRVLNGQRFSF